MAMQIEGPCQGRFMASIKNLRFRWEAAQSFYVGSKVSGWINGKLS